MVSIGEHLLVAALSLLWLAAAVYGTAVLERLVTPPAGHRRTVRIIAQPLAAAAALLLVRAPSPVRPDGALYRSAPPVAFVAAALAGWVVPYGPRVVAGDTPVGLFYFLALLAPAVVALANAGWGANGKYGLFGSMRAPAHIIAYEVALAFAILGPVMAAESLSLVRIVEAQRSLWYVVWQPFGLALYVASAMMAAYRRPFDTPIAGSELSGGVLAEYGGARLLLFRAALSALLFLVAAVGAALYLGGWHGPPVVGPLLPGPVWMLLKTYALVALILWIGRRTPRLGHDQMLIFSWKLVLPVSFVNLAAVGILILVAFR